jgi:hypothetical protein
VPRNPVVNRRNVTPLKQRSLSISDAAGDALTGLAKALHVSQGSLADTALRHLASLGPQQVAELLHLHGHLTDDEYAVVARFAATAGTATTKE